MLPPKVRSPKMLLDGAFWRTLNPGLHLTSDQPLAHASTFGAHLGRRQNDWDLCQSTLEVDGYFAYDAWFDPAYIDRLAACFRALDQAGIPPIFSFVYDEFWDLLLQLDPLLSDLIDDYELPAAIWAWFVKATDQTAFPPHRDQVRDAGVEDDEHLDYLTLWIPLTDLDHTTSNICVVPASEDHNYGQGKPEAAIADPQSIRCLQGQRGSVFGWTTGLIHWGTRQTCFGKPRMSIGACLQAPDAICYDPPLLDFYMPMSLEFRLKVIGQQIVNYARSLDETWVQLAHQWVDR